MKVYKYMTCDIFMGHLETHLRGEVHLSSWRDFNDPMEGYFSYIANSAPKYIVNAIVGNKERYRISCFSKSYRKYLLWSHYTNGHKGVCLEFDVKKPLPDNCILEPITYTKTLPCFDRDQDVEEQARRFLLTKTLQWKQEKEIRLLCPTPQVDNIVLGRLSGIIFGVKLAEGDMADQTLQHIMEAIQDSSHHQTLTLYQAEIEADHPNISRRIYERMGNKKNSAHQKLQENIVAML